ncbi:unnamed protein product [Ascophyllum nodosum]
MILSLFVSYFLLQQCDAFVNPIAVKGIASKKSKLADAHHVTSARSTPSALSALRMAKKSGGAGSKRKKKREARSDIDAEAGTVGRTPVADTETNGLDPLGVTKELEDAGTSMMGGGFGSKSGTQGEVLADNAVGTDAAREAKIEETLRKLGLQGVKEVKGQAGEKKPMGSENSSVLDVVPEETQILIERFLIGGFGLCLLVLIGCGIAIAAEAYFLSTEGKLPPDLDNFVVQTIQPSFTPSLVATFGFSSAWGLLKLGQMGQEGVVYKERD